MYRKDFTGKKFNNLTVLRYSHTEKGRAVWECRCDCGNIVFLNSREFASGNTKSCGCRRVNYFKTHGLSYHPAYKIWQAIKSRCYGKNNKEFHRYGGRGITVCDEWRDHPEAFIAWADLNGYRPDLTIDRIDNDRGYSPDNCQWITRSENSCKMCLDRGFKVKKCLKESVKISQK